MTTQSKDALNVKNTRRRKYCWKTIGNIFDAEGISSPKDSKLRQCSPDHLHLRLGGQILTAFGAAGMTQLVESGAIRGVSNETEKSNKIERSFQFIYVELYLPNRKLLFLKSFHFCLWVNF